MARMMRAVPWRIATPTYGYEPKGNRRAADKRAAQAEVDESFDDLEDDRRLRECWQYFYSLCSPERADRLLDGYDLPKPPSRSRRMPE